MAQDIHKSVSSGTSGTKAPAGSGTSGKGQRVLPSALYSFVHFFFPGPSPPGLLEPMELRLRPWYWFVVPVREVPTDRFFWSFRCPVFLAIEASYTRVVAVGR